MPSPFPGMDPYLEEPSLWPGVHQRLITYIADFLQPQVRPNYRARIGERIYLVALSQNYYPDVVIIERPLREPAASLTTRAIAREVGPPEVTADDPLRLAFPTEERREGYVEIVHAASGEVVTVIEVLSPANKMAGEGHELYKKRQRQLLTTQAHLVEIDLLSEGLPTVAIPPEAYEKMLAYRYLVCVGRFPDRHQAELYLVTLDKRLPRSRIPLREPDPDVALDLPALFDRCYDNGGYADDLDYRQPPVAPLSQEEASWLEGWLREKGLRQARPAGTAE